MGKLIPKKMKEAINDLSHLAAYSDDPMALVDDALRRLFNPTATRVDLRLAAEEASLALTAAVEKVAGKAIRGDRTLQAVLGRLAKHDRSLPARFNRVRMFLHQEVFYQDVFKSPGQVVAGVGTARGVVEQVLAYAGPA